MYHLGRQDSNLRMPVPKTGGLPLADVPSTQNYTDGEHDLETAASISSLHAPPGGTAYDRFVTDPGMPRSRQPPPTRVRRFAVDDDELADFDDFDDFDDDEAIDDEGIEDDYDEDEDEFADTGGGPADSYFDCVSGSGREPPSRKTAGLRNQSLSSS